MTNTNGWTMHDFKDFEDLLIKANDLNLKYAHKRFVDEYVKRQYVQDNVRVIRR